MTPLMNPTETPEAALRRLERSPDQRWVATDAGQALLHECAKRAQAARREAVRA